MNRICNTCNIVKVEIKYLKDRTVYITCYSKKRRKDNNITLIQYQQLKIDKINSNNDNKPNLSTYENHAHVDIGPRNVGNAYYMLKMLEKIGNQRSIHIITRSLNRYPKYKRYMYCL